MIRAWKRERRRRQARTEPSRWMTFDEFERSGHRVRSGRVQQSGCHTTGEIFVRPIEGRYRGRDQVELERLMADLQQQARALGSSSFLTGGQVPLYQQVEMLENILDFELNPPCGCAPPSFKKAAEA